MSEVSPADLSRGLAVVADDLERRGYQLAGVVRQASRLLASGVPVVSEGCCRWCGAELGGRRRDWCSDAHRSRWRRATANRPALVA